MGPWASYGFTDWQSWTATEIYLYHHDKQVTSNQLLEAHYSQLSTMDMMDMQ